MTMIPTLVMAGACALLIVAKLIHFRKFRDWSILSMIPIVLIIMLVYITDWFTNYEIPQATGRWMLLMLILAQLIRVITTIIIKSLSERA